jgi:hypothetical protein
MEVAWLLDRPVKPGDDTHLEAPIGPHVLRFAIGVQFLRQFSESQP